MGLFKSKDIEIKSPVDGEIIPIEQVGDEIFSQKMLGDGLAIRPSNGHYIAPMDGTLVTVFPSGHAYGLKHKSGVELLLHIGVDTVTLNGEGFDIKVKQGEKVRQGDVLVDVDLEAIRSKVPSVDTPIVFTPDTLEGKTLKIVASGKVNAGDLIAVISKSSADEK